MARTAVKIAVLIVVVVSVCLDVCKACGECGTPSTPVYKPPKAPVYYKPPKTPKTPPMIPTFAPPLPKTPPAKTPPSIIPKFGPPPPKTCPVALVQLSVCTPVLGGIVSGILPASKDCCALLNLLGLDLELCLCLAIDANVLGLVNVNAKVDVIASILTTCGYKVPPNLSCPQ